MKKISKCLFLIILVVFSYNFCTIFYNEYYILDWKEEIKMMPQEELDKFDIDDVSKINDEQIKLIKEEYANRYLVSTILIMIVFSIIKTFIDVFLKFYYIWIFIFAYVFANKKFLKSKLSITDYDKNTNYWRSLLNVYSVDVLSYIDNFKLNYPSILIAMLLQLEHKGIIYFDEEKIIINENSHTEVNLRSTESYILKHIENGKLKNISKIEYEEYVRAEAKSNGLLIDKLSSSKLFIKDFIISSIIFILGICLLVILDKKIFLVNNGVMLIILFLLNALLILFLSFFPTYKFISSIILSIKIKNNNSFRNKKGEEINKKLEGLKRFLNDFSAISKREKKELEIWDEYLIYSVMFEQNQDIIKKYKDIIEIFL